jgi:hypothetical protein
VSLHLNGACTEEHTRREKVKNEENRYISRLIPNVTMAILTERWYNLEDGNTQKIALT